MVETRIYLCDDISSIAFVDGLFVLTDTCGDVTIRRAMRPSTFFKCVHGAMALIRSFDSGSGGNVIEMRKEAVG